MDFNPDDTHHYFEGMDYPASKEDMAPASDKYPFWDSTFTTSHCEPTAGDHSSEWISAGPVTWSNTLQTNGVLFEVLSLPAGSHGPWNSPLRMLGREAVMAPFSRRQGSVGRACLSASPRRNLGPKMSEGSDHGIRHPPRTWAFKRGV
jgi:hypothetical protein